MTKTIYDPQYRRLAQHLRKRRIKLGLRQQDLAKRMGWSRHAISRFEQCDRRIDVVEAMQLCRALGIGFSTVERALQEQDANGTTPNNMKEP